MTKQTAFLLAMFSAIHHVQISDAVKTFVRADKIQQAKDLVDIKSSLVTYKLKNPEHYARLEKAVTGQVVNIMLGQKGGDKSNGKRNNN